MACSEARNLAFQQVKEQKRIQMQRFSQEVYQRRKAAGWTRRELARRAGCDPSYITLMERDGYLPGDEIVCALAIALECEVADLLPAGGDRDSLERMAIRDQMAARKLAADILQLRPASRNVVQEFVKTMLRQQGAAVVPIREIERSERLPR